MRTYQDNQGGSLVPYVVVTAVVLGSFLGIANYSLSKTQAKTTTQTEDASPVVAPKVAAPKIVTPKAVTPKKGHRS